MTPRRLVFALAVFAVVPALSACPKKDPPVVDAGPPAPMPTETAAALVPMEEEASVLDTGADVKKPTGPAVNTNVARLKQCCTALGTQAKTLGSSPEAGMFTAAAAQCSALAAQAGPTGTAPEMGVIRNLLAGRTIPAPCAGF